MVDWISLKFKLHAFQTMKPCGNIGRWRSNYATEQIKHWTMSVYWPSSSRCTWKLFCFKEGSNQIQEHSLTVNFLSINNQKIRRKQQRRIFYWQSCVFHFRFKVMWKPQPMSIKRLLGKKSQWPEWWLLRLTVHVLAILQLTLVSLRYDWKEIFTINFFLRLTVTICPI